MSLRRSLPPHASPSPSPRPLPSLRPSTCHFAPPDTSPRDCPLEVRYSRGPRGRSSVRKVLTWCLAGVYRSTPVDGSARCPFFCHRRFTRGSEKSRTFQVPRVVVQILQQKGESTRVLLDALKGLRRTVRYDVVQKCVLYTIRWIDNSVCFFSVAPHPPCAAPHFVAVERSDLERQNLLYKKYFTQ